LRKNAHANKVIRGLGLIDWPNGAHNDEKNKQIEQ